MVTRLRIRKVTHAAACSLKFINEEVNKEDVKKH
jgi:hypothetical protein